MSLILSAKWSGMNKEKVLDKAVWVNGNCFILTTIFCD